MAFQQYPQKLGIPSGTTAQRPSSPVIGDTYYNGTLGLLEIYDGTNWVPSSAPAGIPSVAATDVGTGRAFGSGAIAFTFTPGTNGGSPYGYTGIATLSSSSYSIISATTTATLVVAGTGSYSVTGTAYNGFGTSPANPAINVDVTTLPQAPTIGTATAGTTNNQITVTWTLGSNGGKNLSAIEVVPYLNGTTAQTAQTAATTSSTSLVVTGLTATSSYTFKVRTVNANGTSLESAASNSATFPDLVSVSYLIIAGGGAGGTDGATGAGSGGGGAGGYRTNLTGQTSGGGASAEALWGATKSTALTVTVGAGGATNSIGSSSYPNNGANSVFASFSTAGGGYGAFYTAPLNYRPGASGGSGGGGDGFPGSNNATIGGTGTANQGFDGGRAFNNAPYAGAGGGGAGAVGVDATSNTGGNGGVGVASNINGTSTTRAGGGGGAQGNTTAGGAGSGGSGGGGAGGPYNANSVAGTANTGGGGGGGNANVNYLGANGGSGLIILRIPSANSASFSGGVTQTMSTAVSGFKVYTITAAGSGDTVTFS
jgi:hypothetical protein